jgi:uncharacterized protein YciI
MQLDRFTIALLGAAPDAPRLDDAAAAAMQDAHMSHLADLHDAGALLAAGPLLDGRLRGLSILNVEPGEALELKRRDPAVRAGLYTVEAIPWLVPGGAISFAPTRFPRSIAEVTNPDPGP